MLFRSRFKEATVETAKSKDSEFFFIAIMNLKTADPVNSNPPKIQRLHVNKL
jgi:hypothetical protein